MAAQFRAEEERIEELVSNGAWGKTYLDIGAFHPIELSNTYRLYERGWSGDIYEPLPDLLALYARVRPRDRFFNVAVSDSDGESPFWIMQGQNRGVSTLEEAWVRRLPYEYKRVMVSTVDANTLCGVYDFCSLDIEGHESNVIHRMDFNKLRIGVFLIESLEHRSCLPTFSKWESALLEANYEFIGQCSPLNRFYRHLEYSG